MKLRKKIVSLVCAGLLGLLCMMPAQGMPLFSKLSLPSLKSLAPFGPSLMLSAACGGIAAQMYLNHVAQSYLLADKKVTSLEANEYIFAADEECEKRQYYIMYNAIDKRFVQTAMSGEVNNDLKKKPLEKDGWIELSDGKIVINTGDRTVVTTRTELARKKLGYGDLPGLGGANYAAGIAYWLASTAWAYARHDGIAGVLKNHSLPVLIGAACVGSAGLLAWRYGKALAIARGPQWFQNVCTWTKERYDNFKENYLPKEDTIAKWKNRGFMAGGIALAIIPLIIDAYMRSIASTR